MHFAYDGFEHDAGKRSFLFRRVEAGAGADQSSFAIEIDLSLLARNRVAVQDAPLFCIRMLLSALKSSEEELEKLHSYRVGVEDFRDLNTERAKREAELRFRRGRTRSKPRPAASLPGELFSAKPIYAV